MIAWHRNAILLIMLLATSGLAIALRPTHRLADERPKVELETMIPKAFGDWREVNQRITQIVNPQQEVLLNKLYRQILSRVYVNHSGYQIMLSIAYGSNQSDSLQVHRPEVCYPAQGFALQSVQDGKLVTQTGTVPVTRILATLDQRSEPVTYWKTVGDQVIHGAFNKKIVEIQYALTGKIPDGMLIRVSSIDSDTSNAYRFHDEFFSQMLKAVAPEHRRRLAGNLLLN